MEDIEQINEEFNVKKPKKKALIITAIVIAVIVIALLIVYSLVFARPQYVFNTAIDKLFSIESRSYDSVKIDTSIKVSAELEDTTMQEQIDELEKMTLNMGMQMDVENRQEIIDLGLQYDNESVIDAKVYYDSENVYAYFDEIFDRYIEIDMTEEEKSQIDEIFGSVNTNTEDTEAIMEIIAEELKNQINEEGTFEKDKVTIEIAGEEEKVTSSTLILNQKEFVKVIANMCSNLADNEEFIGYFDDTAKETLEQLAEELEETETNTKDTIEFTIYTKGLFNKSFVGFEVELYSDDDDLTVTFTVLKEDDGVYSYNVEEKDSSTKMDILSGTVETEKEEDSTDEKKGKTAVSVTIPDTGTIKIEVDYSILYNQGIDTIDIQESVSINDLTEEDLQAIIEKLMERPLIGELIENQMSSTGTDYITDGTDDYSTTLTTSENQVSGYGYSVTYTVPETFEYDSDYSYDYRKYYSLENDDYSYDVAVGISWYTDDEYIEYIEWDYDYYTESSYYQNVNMGELTTINVGDNEFKYQILSYDSNSEYYSESYQTAYIWYRLDDEYMFAVEIDATDIEISETLIQSFLDIQVS